MTFNDHIETVFEIDKNENTLSGESKRPTVVQKSVFFASQPVLQFLVHKLALGASTRAEAEVKSV